MAPLLEVTDATIRFGGVTAVDAVSFTMDEGEVVGLIGPNGAGKSTLFGAIAGGVRLTSGSVAFDAERITGLRPSRISRRGLARTFQKVRLFGSMTVAENVTVAAASHHRGSSVAEAAAQALDATGIGDLAGRVVSSISLADRKKVEIARGLAARPRLLLLDEMMNGLTTEEAEQLTTLVLGLPGRGVSVMLVEHVMPVVRRACQRLLVLQQGKLIADGTPDDVLTLPVVRSAYLGTAAGEPPAAAGGPDADH